MTICFLEFDAIWERMFRSKLEYPVYESLIERLALKGDDAQISIRSFNKGTGQDRADYLVEAAKNLEAKHLGIYEGHDWEEIVAQHVYREVERHPLLYDRVFGHTKDEATLYSKIRGYLQREGEYDAYVTADSKRERWPDVFCAKPGRIRGTYTVSIDAKVRYSEFARFLEQCTMFSRYSNHVFVCTTPGMIAEVGMKRRGAIANGEKEFKSMLDTVGAGAYVIDLQGGRDAIRRVHDGSDSQNLDEREKARRLEMLRIAR